MREHRAERALEHRAEPDVLPRPAAAISGGDVHEGCCADTFKEANVLTYGVAEHAGCVLVVSGRKGEGDRLTAGVPTGANGRAHTVYYCHDKECAYCCHWAKEGGDDVRAITRGRGGRGARQD